jgi:hypothetical protein
VRTTDDAWKRHALAIPGPSVDFVEKSRDALLRHWNCQIETRQMLDPLETVVA